MQLRKHVDEPGRDGDVGTVDLAYRPGRTKILEQQAERIRRRVGLTPITARSAHANLAGQMFVEAAFDLVEVEEVGHGSVLWLRRWNLQDQRRRSRIGRLVRHAEPGQLADEPNTFGDLLVIDANGSRVCRQSPSIMQRFSNELRRRVHSRKRYLHRSSPR